MSKYIRKARRRELAFAGSQLTFDFSARPGEFVPDSKVSKTERRLMLRTDDASVRHLAEWTNRRTDKDGDTVPCPVTVINDFISSRRGKRDDANEHGLWTRYDIMSHDLEGPSPRRKNGIKARLLTKEYPEGILVTCHSVKADPGSSDPLTFTVGVTRD